MSYNNNIFDRRKSPIEEAPLVESQIVPEPNQGVPQPEPADTNIEISTLNQTEQEEANITFPVRFLSAWMNLF